MRAHLFIVVLLGSFTSFSSSTITPPASYGLLAREIGPSYFSLAIQKNDALNATTMPKSEALSDFRKALLAAREVLDTFVYAYPIIDISSSKHNTHDVWLRARTDLDEGYTDIGDFQDLGNVDSGDKLLVKQRDKCLRWKSLFLWNAFKYNYSTLFANPDVLEMHVRPRKELSDKYWRLVPTPPSSSISGLLNLATLLRAMLDQLVKQLAPLQLLPTMYDSTSVNELHDYKKQMRAAITLYNWYSALWNVTSNQQVAKLDAALRNVTRVYSAFDETHGLALKPVFYTSVNETLAFRETALAAQLSWQELNRFLTHIAWREQLYLLQAFIITRDP